MSLGPNSEPENSASDHTLLRRVREGEEDAATALYMRYARRLLRLAERQTPRDISTRIDAEDVVQSVFRTFFRRAATGSYEIPQGEDLWKLLLVISLNKVRTLCAFHRASKRDVGSTSSMFGSLPNGSERPREWMNPTSDAPLHVLEMTIRELLAGQPAVNEQIVTLRIEGHEIADIATQVQRSKRTVERVLQTFREQLDKTLRDEIPGTDAENAE